MSLFNLIKITFLIATFGQNLYALSPTITIPASGGRADAKVYLPDQYTPSKAWPVILLLHGYTGNAFLIDSYFGLSAQTSKRGFILIVPNGKVDSQGHQFWNATEGCCDFDHSGSDDVGYLKALLADVESRYNVDKSRVFAAGHSNGGFMAYSLACESNSPFAAIVSFAGETFKNPADCKATHPVSVLQIHALDDDTIHYAGDPVGYPKLAPYPGTEETMAQWVAIDGCRSVPQKGSDRYITVANNTQTQQWMGCRFQSQVRLWTIQPYTSPLHFPHTPLLTSEFTESILDFLLLEKFTLSLLAHS